MSFIRNLLSDKIQKGEKRILRMANTKNEKDFGTGIPENAVEALARVLLPEIEKFYNSEEGKAAFEKWKSEKEKETA